MRIKNLGIVCAAIVSLAGGCVEAELLPFNAKPVVSTVVYVGGARVVIGGPVGFCINSRQSRTTDAGAFVVLGPCDAAAGETKGLLIANVSADASFGQSMPVTALDSYFRTDTGRRALSNSGEAGAVHILESVIKQGVYYIHTRDSSAPLIPDTTTEKWRGFFPISGRMVSISLVNFVEKPMSASAVFGQLRQFAQKIINLNGVAL